MWNTTSTHVMAFKPHVTLNARGKNTVRDRLHWPIKELILLRLFAVGKMLLSEHINREGGLGFIKAGRRESRGRMKVGLIWVAEAGEGELSRNTGELGGRLRLAMSRNTNGWGDLSPVGGTGLRCSCTLSLSASCL